MAKRRFFGGSNQRSARRRSSWDLGPGADDLATLDIATLASTGDSIYGTGAAPVLPHLTLVRLRGMLTFQLQSTDAAGSGFNYAVGIGIASADAFVAGVASLPKPFTDIDWPGWIWHHMGRIVSPVGAAAVTSDQMVQMIPIDSKAMRKFGSNEVIFAVGEFAEIGTSVCLTSLVTRGLFKLP